MKWILRRRDADGLAVDVEEFDSHDAARDAQASYEIHYPEYKPYFIEKRESPAAAAPGPKFVPLPAPVLSPAAPEEAADATAESVTSGPSRKTMLLALAGALAVGALLSAFFFTERSRDNPVAETTATAQDARETPNEEPTAPPVVTEPADDVDPPRRQPSADPAPPPTPTAVPPPTATPEAEEDVRLTQGSSTLDRVLSRGELNCGVSGVAVGFSETQPDGSMQGFDADMCRAVAAAILGDAEAVNFVELRASERFTALVVGDVDVLMRNSTWTQSRDTDLGLDFGPTTYFDGQQLMGRAGDGFDTASQIPDIDGAIVCTLAGTTTELNMLAAAEEAGVSIELLTFEDFDTMTDAFTDGACDLITTDGIVLVARKAEDQPDDQEWVIFPKTPITKEPLGPIYEQDDSRFADVVNWTVFAMLTADENDINQANVLEFAADPPPGAIGRLLGGPGELQSLMGLSPDAFLQVIAQVGSYSDVHNRHLEPLGLVLDGSLNDLWFNGGLMYPPPVR